MPVKSVELFGFEGAFPPKDITGSAQTGLYVSLKNYSHLTAIIFQGAWAGGTPAVTLEQATAIAGTAAKALAFSKRWTKVSTSGNFVETAVTSDTFNLPATANTINVLEIDAADLDTDNGFDCVHVAVATPGSNADLMTIIYLLTGARYPQATMVDAKLDAA